VVRFGIQPGPALHEEGQGENKQVRPGEPSRRVSRKGKQGGTRDRYEHLRCDRVGE